MDLSEKKVGESLNLYFMIFLISSKFVDIKWTQFGLVGS